MEEQRVKSLDTNKTNGNFPIGMSVLAVDDDPTCLKVLEQLLRRCHYEVTTTDRATMALTILMDHRDKFDLVITEINLPDMDGFEFLEHVGLEMGLPVVILSEHSDTELVMKAVTRGACDYLLKPVRMEEMSNVWQHVVRQKIAYRGKGKAHGALHDNARALVISDSADQNARRTRRRREHGEGEDQEDIAQENDDPATLKKPRVVWCIDLHKKFVAAVNHLGIDSAVPKKILELMNVEGLTRENVASHLQKYRLYLKRIQDDDQVHMLAPLSARDSSWYMGMASSDVYRDFRSFSEPGRMASNFKPGGSFGRLNSSLELSYPGLQSSGLLLPGHTQSVRSSTNTLGRTQTPVLPLNLSSNLLEGVPNSLELNQIKQTVVTSSVAHSSGFTVPANFLGSRGGEGIGSSSNASMFQGNKLQPHDLWTYRSSSSNWRGAAPLSQFPSKSLTFGDPFPNEQPVLSGLNISSSSSREQNRLIEIPSSNTVPVLPEDSRRGVQRQDGLLRDGVQAAGVTLGLFGQYSQQPNAFCSNSSDASLTGRFNGATQSMQSSGAGNSSMGADMMQTDGFVPSDFEPVEDSTSMMVKRA